MKKWVRATFEAVAYTNTLRAEGETAATSDPSYLQPLIEAAAKYNQIPRSFPARDLYFKG